MLDMDVDIEDLDDSKKDLQTVLPRLARRITQKQQGLAGDKTIVSVLNPAQKSPSSSTRSLKDDEDDAPAERAAGGARRRHTRRSVTGSICYAAQDLPPEIRSLREQDIYNEPDSAADRALNAVSQMAATPNAQGAEAEYNDSGAPAPERRSSSAQRVEGREVQQDHAQYALTYGMMLGIRCTTGRREQQFGGSAHGSSSNLSGLGGVSPRGSSVTVEEERELVAEDYSQTTKLLFLPEGNRGGPFPTPPHRLPFAFGFKDYTPHVFRALRALNNVDEADYMTSLAGDFNYIEFLANSKSGQFFFYSHDGRFMIKTQTREEAKLLREMLPSYVKHLVEHPDSLLARFYGLHRVEMPTLKRRTFFVVMQSVFYCPVEPPLALHVKFDLKGSTVGRRTDDADCADGAVQKDLNFAEQRRRLVLGRDKVLLFAETLRADTNYLKELRIMDYSLLLGVHDPSEERRLSQLSQQRQQRRRSSGGVVLARRRDTAGRASVHFDAPGAAPAAPDVWEEQQRLPSQWVAPSIFNEHCGGIRSANAETQEVYFMGIIDILQVYNTNKRLENFFKGFSHDRRQLSAVDPALYAERMVQFLLKHSDYADAIAASKSSARGGHGASAAANGSRRSSEPVPVAESTPTRSGQPQRHSTGGVASAASAASPPRETTGATQHTPFGGPRRQNSAQPPQPPQPQPQPPQPQPQPQSRHAESYKLL